MALLSVMTSAVSSLSGCGLIAEGVNVLFVSVKLNASVKLTHSSDSRREIKEMMDKDKLLLSQNRAMLARDLMVSLTAVLNSVAMVRLQVVLM